MNEADLPRSSEDIPEPRVDEQERGVILCDRCGFEMIERHCKVVCPNCGARWDCSDLTIYTD
jgi:exosome complex RNA-binding protein Csl4